MAYANKQVKMKGRHILWISVFALIFIKVIWVVYIGEWHSTTDRAEVQKAVFTIYLCLCCLEWLVREVEYIGQVDGVYTHDAFYVTRWFNYPWIAYIIGIMAYEKVVKMIQFINNLADEHIGN